MKPRSRCGLAVAALLAIAPVTTAAAQQSAAGSDPRQVVLDAVIMPSEVIEISGGVLTGVLERIHVERGDFVVEGQLLAVIDSRLEQAMVDLAQARVDLVAALEASRSARDYFANAMERANRLYDEQIISIDLREQAQEEALLAESRYQVEVEAHAIAELELQRAIVALEMRKLTSPVTGMVTERLIPQGEFVGQATLLTIAKLDPLFVEVVVPAVLYGSIQVGMAAVVIPGEPIGGSHPAVVTVVDNVLDAASNTFGVRLELPNPGYALPAGLRGQVSFTLRSSTTR